MSTTIPSGKRAARPFALAQRRVRIAPSLLAADFSRLHEEVARIERAGAEVLHLDVMDGHFVPNISFGVPVIASLREHSRMFFDAHLMIEEPKRYAEAFVKAGCDHITFHIEVTKEPRAVIEHIRGLGVSAGICINPATEVAAIEPVLNQVDLVLVMSVWPGFGGQSFMAEVLPKVTELRNRLRSDQRLEIDGGIDARTIADAARAGADTFVAGTAIFPKPDPAAAYAELKTLAESA
jgi:ribulose-phosphate 3-epimerase